MTSKEQLRTGIFIPPHHPNDEDLTLAMHRDFELVEWLDKLGYDEAWIGEHHSAGYEIFCSPELFIAAAAERTRRIMLGTGVVSLPYHHPLMVAGRLVQLDHQTRGRVMFGVGPGALPSDAFMMGIEVEKQREMMDEALAALVPLLRGETVNLKTNWFELVDARLQLKPYTRPHIEIAVASQVSPSGARAAGKYGLSLLSIGATTTGGFNALAANWAICEQRAQDFGQVVRRDGWRLVAPMHIAETREKARENVRFGLGAWLDYFRRVAALPLAPEGAIEDAVDALNASGFAVIGDVDDAIAQVERLQKQSGGFGCLLQMAHEWADREATRKSYELIARYVMPRFQGALEGTVRSRDWAADNRPRFIGAAMQAIQKEIVRHAEEQAAKADGHAEGAPK
jgi:limonene 1,2-monooxygenase